MFAMQVRYYSAEVRAISARCSKYRISQAQLTVGAGQEGSTGQLRVGCFDVDQLAAQPAHPQERAGFALDDMPEASNE